MKVTESTGSMEPMLPPDGERKLEDLAMDLATKASGLVSQLSPAVRQGVGDLVRSMNCYYSNLIEGHDILESEIKRLCTSPYTISTHALLKGHLDGMDNIRRDVLAKELLIPEHVIESLLKTSATDYFEKTYMVFLGKAASGKSTLIREIIKKHPTSTLTLEHFIIPLVHKYGNEASAKHVPQMFEDVAQTFSEGSFKILELATDCAIEVISTVANSIKTKGANMLIIYCSTKFDTSLSRNKERQRPVPEVVLEYQKSVEQDEGYFNSLNDISDHVLNLDTEGALSECIMKIEETLQLMHNE